jgi:hypothetical protein
MDLMSVLKNGGSTIVVMIIRNILFRRDRRGYSYFRDSNSTCNLEQYHIPNRPSSDGQRHYITPEKILSRIFIALPIFALIST